MPRINEQLNELTCHGTAEGDGLVAAIALPLFCLGRIFRAPDDMDNVYICMINEEQ